MWRPGAVAIVRATFTVARLQRGGAYWAMGGALCGQGGALQATPLRGVLNLTHRFFYIT